jgi:N-acetylneuraminic acid mutarotase
MKKSTNLTIRAHLLRGPFYVLLLLTGTLLAYFRPEAPTNVSPRTLTFAERISYQRAIEDVYWRHRIWPKANAGSKPSLDKIMSQREIEKKVQDYLRNSQALEDYWQRPITTEQLQAEMDRMAHHTKQPDVLRELFAALGDDPFVVAECLARPVLAQRLVTELKSEDRVKLTTVAWLKRPLRSSVTRVETQALVTMAALNANYTLPTISSPSAGCIDDTWTSTSITNAPDARYNHTAVWTGSEMIVWGGYSNGFVNTGGRYNPSTDSWTATTTTNAPIGRESPTAVWTGSEMIIWGGDAGSQMYLNTGGRYNPITDTWTATSTTNAPAGRHEHTAVWTGGEMIIWGGGVFGSTFNTGGRYNPGTDSWTATSTTNAPSARAAHTAVWIDGEMVVWGGANVTSYFNTGGRYNPGTDSWTATSTTNAPLARSYHTAVWTGSQMIVWGGQGGSYLNSGGRYDPGTDSWTATSTTNAPTGRLFHTAVWTSSEMIVWGGQDTNLNYLNTGGRYNPGTDSWTATSTTNAPTGRGLPTAVWTGGQMIVWGGYNGSPLNTGGKYCAQSGSSTPTPTATATPTATPTPTSCGSIMQIGGGIVPGTTDIGNHCDDCVTTVSLPFPFTLYDQTFTAVNLSSNGNAQFTTMDPGYSGQCLPWIDHNYTIFPYWDDLYLVNSGYGIYTSISGTVPNRIFNIEWRAQYFPGTGTANFELRLYEGQARFDVIYGTATNGNLTATAGVQRDNTCFTQYFCNGSGPPPIGGWTNGPAGTPTPTPTPTGCSVTTSCPEVIFSQPTDFIIDVSDAVDPTTVQASDFTVNGISADSFALLNGNTTIIFHFNTTPVVQGLNTMHIPACAFNCGNGCVQEFTCTFTYKPSTPTPTQPPPSPTATATSTATPTATATATFTPTSSPTTTPPPSPTATSTLTPRPTPTPRGRATPRSRPTPPPRP